MGHSTMTKGFSNPENKTAKELTKKRQTARYYGFKANEGLHDEYKNHPRAQYVMSFTEYKKLRKNQKKFAVWIQENPMTYRE